jgi:thiol-disulfide isomerase/thioredoxin
MRLLCAAALSLSLGLSLAADDKKDPPKDDRAARLKALKDKFNVEVDQFGKKFQKAQEKGDRAGMAAAQTEAKEMFALTSQKALAVAKEDPKDATGGAAAAFAVRLLATFGTTDKDLDAATGILLEHHLNSQPTKDAVIDMGGAGAFGQKFLKAVAAKATDKEVKGTALFYIGSHLASEADDEDDDKKADELAAEATKHLEQAAKEAPEAMVGGQPLKKAAADEIASLKALKATSPGNPAPEAAGTGLDGKKMKLADFKGKVVLLDIWATWCPPCRAMIPHEREMVKKLDGKPFVLLSVSADTKKDTLTDFLKDEQMPWQHWWDGKDNPLFKAYRVKAFPTLYLIDAKGVIRKKWVGSPGNDVLDKAVEEVVKEAGGGKQ